MLSHPDLVVCRVRRRRFFTNRRTHVEHCTRQPSQWKGGRACGIHLNSKGYTVESHFPKKKIKFILNLCMAISYPNAQFLKRRSFGFALGKESVKMFKGLLVRNNNAMSKQFRITMSRQTVSLLLYECGNKFLSLLSRQHKINSWRI